MTNEANVSDLYRLPRNAVPVRYDLTIEPDLTDATFAGSCATTIDVREDSVELTSNAIELEITRAWVASPDNGVRIEVDRISYDEATERVTFGFAEPVRVGTWILNTEFTGILNDKLHGFYLSTFTDTDGVEQRIATTQFEATDARRAFPCWDEPDLKATFGITLVVEPDQLALSNAAELTRATRTDGKVAVTFSDTMRMSTYLVAFIVGPLDVTDAVDVNGVPLRVAYPRGKGHLTSFALEVGAFCLDFYGGYYGIPYPADKLDLVAIPDFAFGAMENLGCVTFREVLLLVDPTEVTQPELQSVTDVIAHELAHMWFGDLVTMKWWNGIWLNEAFATFMEMLATDAFRPEWDRWSSFGLSRTAAFDVDSLASTRPIEYPVVSPDDAEGMFDVLTYEKGAAVVRMLEQYLGPDAFRDGIRLYLSRNAYANTETTDLWDSLEEATGEPVRRIMDSWILQGGYPVIDVELVDDGNTIRLTQRPFTYTDPGDDPRRWSIPVIITQGFEGATTVEKVLIEGDSLDLPVLEELEWVVVNTEATGFFRVRYAPDLLAALTARAQRELSPVERYGLIDDAWAAVLAATMGTVAFLGFVESFADEDDLSVWQRIVGTLTTLDRLVEDDARKVLRGRIHDLVAPALERLGREPLDTDSDRRRELRGLLTETLGTLADDATIEIEARELHERHRATPGSVDPSLVSAATAIIAATGGPSEFDDFVACFESATTPQEQLRYLSALADFDDAECIERVLAMSVTDRVRTQNAPYLLRRAMTNRNHGAAAWGFIRANWEEITTRFPSNSIVRMLEGVRALSRPEVASTVTEFFATHEVPQGDKQLAQHLERLGVNVALRERESHELARHLQ